MTSEDSYRREVEAGEVRQIVGMLKRGADSPSRETRETCAERDGYACARCGRSLRGVQASLHHRRRRSHAFDGLHDASNLIWLCGSGTTGCHGWVHEHPELAFEHGYLVHAWQDPRKVPVDHCRWGVCYLWSDGTAGTVPEP